MMRFLVIAQDLRVSGTSEGIVSRSFLSKLRVAYQDAVINVLYLKHHPSDDQLDLLPVDSIETHLLNLKIPFFTKWVNKIYWRLFHVSLSKKHIDKVYGLYIGKIDYQKYDHIFIRSSGLGYETILGAKDLPILKKAIINFHDPYPVFWDTGSKKKISNLELFRFKEMYEVVTQAKICIAPASLLSEDMEHLYGSNKKFYTLPHQYNKSVFDFSDTSKVRLKSKEITISYHGAIQFGRNIDILLDAYQELIENNFFYKENTELVLRLNGQQNKRLREKYSKIENIFVLDTLSFSNSSYEQIHQSDVVIILENCSTHSNILVGKAPFLASLNKLLLSLSPERSEMRRLIQDNSYTAHCNDKEEIKLKLENLIINRMNSNNPVYPFGDYFDDENFKKMLDIVLFEKRISTELY
ncbi:glycosyltransferase family protein [Flavobacterium gawalongense]|uniref:Glycosyltransferase family 4 protein n=1 Tax=Flavobacterium gawalongense TaxID=2594432 RepID=A0A553BZ59_9FLAO|nr:glycosyltransferase family 4 protein [Flavobacterium gawalongense]TRX13478.1 glycosyltransferase family 4 protein [Flavobacterium gawalongense]TRX15590.1 glycosyltransferase family 4 protein [Flavobacterium gawalongense]TRX31428.1 glycosyltransferase family 4 protein [Flavobacterium gawalongense]